MNYFKYFLFLALLIFSSNNVFAESWIDTGTYNNAQIFLDIDSIKKNDRFIFYNIKRENSESGEGLIITIQSDPENNFAGIVTQQTYTEFYQKDLPYLLVGQQKAKTMKQLEPNSPMFTANKMAINYLKQQTLNEQQQTAISQYNNMPAWQQKTNNILNTVNQTNTTWQNIINTLYLFRFRY